MLRRAHASVSLCASLTVFLPSVCCAFDDAKRTTERPLIEAYEPNILGYKWQDDDVGFIDIKVSLKYRLFPDHIANRTCAERPGCDDRWRAYLGFTGRFGFYLRTRASDPVIAKTFNPKLLVRYTPGSARNDKAFWERNGRPIFEDWSYLDLAYAHESNGQTISTEGAYELEQRLNRRHPDFALDKVSRGWDYIQLAGKYSLLKDAKKSRLAIYGDLKYFPRDGLVQGVPEEYHSFENDPSARRRSAYDGVSAAIEFEHHARILGKDASILENPRLMLQLETGYDPAFRFSTVRLEVGAKLIELPIALWYQNGYGSSLARYYKHTNAYGIQLRMAE
jgi:hypothetical protein